MIRMLSLSAVIFLIPASVAAFDETRRNTINDELQSLHGLWRGSWGGGSEDDGVVRQPVVTELYIAPGRAEWKGLPISDGSGAIDLHRNGKRRWGRFTYSASPNGTSKKKSVVFDYGIKGETLTLTFTENGSHVSLRRIATEQASFADMNVDFELARGIDGNGNLLLTTFNAIKVGNHGTQQSSPNSLVRPLKNASIFRVEVDRTMRITEEEARQLIRKDQPVVVASRISPIAKPTAVWGLARKVGKLQPDSEAGLRTLTALLKRGTLIFVIPEAERVPIP